MNSQSLAHEVEETTKELRQTLFSFPPSQVNVVPAGGGWTAAQVAVHLSKASVVEPLYGPVKPTTRAPDQYVLPLREQFLDFTTKLRSPEFILPADGTYDRDTLLAQLESIGNRVRAAIQSLDLTATASSLPGSWGN